MSDADFEAAISSLEASAVAIEQQCRLLESQKQALAEIRARNSERKAAITETDRDKRFARQRAQLDFEADELQSSLRATLQDSSKQADAAVTALSPSIDRVLEKDDRILDGLQKLLPKLEDSNASPDASAEVERLCDALTLLTAQDIRARMDAAYCAIAGTAGAQIDGDTGTPESKKKLRSLSSELDELSGEIDSLATMAVDSQYRQPILRELKSSASQASGERNQWALYVAEVLQYLTERLVTLEDHFESLHAHQGALRHIAVTIDSVLEQSPPRTKGDAQEAARSPATPTSTRGLKPLRLVEAKRLSGPLDPVAQMLRHFDLRVPDPSDTNRLEAVLQQAQRDREAQLEQLRMTTEKTITDQLAQSLSRAHGDLDDILAAVYAHSPHGAVRLVDGGVQSQLSSLQTSTDDLGQRMRNLDLDGILYVVRENQKKIIEDQPC